MGNSTRQSRIIVVAPQVKDGLASNTDLLSKMIKIGQDQKLPHMQRLINEIARVEKRAGISVRNYMGFGDDPEAVLEYFKDQNGGDCIGERNAKDINGRGICIWSDGLISIGYWNNNDLAPGHYINIFSDGGFHVGEVHLKDGEMCWRGTDYKTDGTSSKFD